MKLKNDAYSELAYYTLAHTSPAFIHQHIVDAFTAQNAGEHTKPIALAFSLIGLYLYLEKNYTGKQVQLAHMKLAKNRKQWPTFEIPEQRGAVSVDDVLRSSPGQKRDEMVYRWCVSVWKSFKNSHQQIADLVAAELF